MRRRAGLYVLVWAAVVTSGCADSPAPAITAPELDATAAANIAAPAAAATWTPQQLDLLPGLPGNCCALGWAINAAGDVVGKSLASTGTFHAVRWQGKTAFDLGVPTGYGDSEALSINDAGTIVGVATLSAAPWRAGVIWPTSGGMTVLTGPGPTAVETSARDINNAGTIVGEYAVGGQLHAFRYTSTGGYVDINPPGYVGSGALSVADNGAIAGYARPTTGRLHAAYWAPNGTFTDLGTAGGDTAYAFGVNSLGQAVGSAEAPSQARLPFLWQAATGMRTVTSPGQGMGISDGQRVVAFVNAGGTLRAATKLGNGASQLLPVFPSTTISWGFGVNRCGSIAGEMTQGVGVVRAVRWVIATCDP